MAWVFERDNEVIRFETRYDNETSEYVLIAHRVDGKQHVERFKDTATFQSRLDALDRQLQFEDWHAVSASVPLRDGWKI